MQIIYSSIIYFIVSLLQVHKICLVHLSEFCILQYLVSVETTII